MEREDCRALKAKLALAIGHPCQQFAMAKVDTIEGAKRRDRTRIEFGSL